MFTLEIALNKYYKMFVKVCGFASYVTSALIALFCFDAQKLCCDAQKPGNVLKLYFNVVHFTV